MTRRLPVELFLGGAECTCGLFESLAELQEHWPGNFPGDWIGRGEGERSMTGVDVRQLVFEHLDLAADVEELGKKSAVLEDLEPEPIIAGEALLRLVRKRPALAGKPGEMAGCNGVLEERFDRLEVAHGISRPKGAPWAA